MSLVARGFGAALALAGRLVRLVPDLPRDPLAAGTSGAEVGRPAPRRDGTAKVTGGLRYTAEHPRPALAEAPLAYAALVLSTVARGRITGIEDAAARAVPGVRLVMTQANAPPVRSVPALATLRGPLSAAAMSLPILGTDEVSWNGQPVAVVVADTAAAAAEAAARVRVSYASAPAILDFHAALPDAFEPPHAGFEAARTRIGDVAGGLAGAAHVVDALYETPPEHHAAMEPHATLAWWAGDHLHVRDATQYAAGVRDMLARRFGLPKASVTVEADFLGGSFGGKAAAWPHVTLAAQAARLAGRPVRLALTRRDVFLATGGRAPTRTRVRLGADGGGRLTALGVESVSACAGDVFAEAAIAPARHLYGAPAFDLAQRVTRLDRIQNTFMRAPGDAPGSFALECAMDELALATGRDPLALRRLNEPARHPTKGTAFSSRHLLECYAVGADLFGWEEGAARPRLRREGHERIGQGMAAAVYPVQQFAGSVRLTLHADGTARIETGHAEMGVGAATAQAQASADRLGLPLAKVALVHGRGDAPPFRVPGGSATTATLASAIHAARDALVRECLRLAKGTGSALDGVRFAEVECAGEGLVRRGHPQQGASYRAILEAAGREAITVTGKAAPPYMAMKHAMQAYGAHFCEVRVDAELGQVRVVRWVGSFDAGRILNPATARSQIVGGIVMGLGMALTEDLTFDPRTGRVANGDLAGYHVPTQADVPEIAVHFLDRPDPLTPLGLKGLGEIGTCGVAAAVANAVFDATGRRVRTLPITPDRLL